MKAMLSDAFKGLVKQFDADQIQFMIWQYEDAIKSGMFNEQDMDKVMSIISYLKMLIGQSDDASSTLSKMPICLN